MSYLLSKRTLNRVFITGLCLFATYQLYSQPKTITFPANDKVPVTADLYLTDNLKAPFIILFHQAKYSRGEYLETAPKLNDLGYNCMAVDLRSGDEINSVDNMTYQVADSLGKETRYIDAVGDMRAAVAYIKRTYPGTKIILFGSSYSASLSLKLASDSPEGISGVIAFSPGEYFSKFGWSNKIIQLSVPRIKCPVFITSAKDEQPQWQAIYDAIPLSSKVSYIPSCDGMHGSKVLWKEIEGHEEYWNALKAFLKKYY
ncbi:MAG: alpha/beta hydrolase [Bacteroidales bacterium]|nr:alpha/beta hydrolase [Bacteroidales bacterium]